MDMITEEVKPKKKWQYVPGKNVRSHIAKWEAEDFVGQNAKFGGDAVGAKAKELQNLLGEDIGKRLTTKELDGLLATYYNLSPDSFKRVILPAVKEYAMDPTVQNSNKLYDTMMNRYKIAPAKYQKGIKRRAAADTGLMGIQRSEPIMLEQTADGGKILTVDPSVYGLQNHGFESTWKPVQPIKTDYNLNNPTPQSISSWSGADAPNATPRLKDFQEVRQEDLNRGINVYGDPVSPFSLRLRLPSLTSLLQLNSPEEQAKQYFADVLGISDMSHQTPSLFPKLKDGKVPNDPYERFKYSLPDNQKNTPESEYNTRRYWELNGRPKSFQEAVEREMYDLQEDGWHANSVSYNQDTGEYEFMKPRNHPTVHKELEWYNSDDAKEFRKKYKHIQPKDSNFDKYVPRLKNGKLPGFADGNVPNIFRRPNGSFFYQGDDGEIDVTPLNTTLSDDPSMWTYVDQSGKQYTPRLQPTNQGTIQQDDRGAGEKFWDNYIGELKYDLNNDKVVGGKYTLPAIGLGALGLYGASALGGLSYAAPTLTESVGLVGKNIYGNAARDFALSMLGGRALDEASMLLTGNSVGKNISNATEGYLPTIAGDFLNTGYLLGGESGNSIYQFGRHFFQSVPKYARYLKKQITAPSRAENLANRMKDYYGGEYDKYKQINDRQNQEYNQLQNEGYDINDQYDKELDKATRDIKATIAGNVESNFEGVESAIEGLIKRKKLDPRTSRYAKELERLVDDSYTQSPDFSKMTVDDIAEFINKYASQFGFKKDGPNITKLPENYITQFGGDTGLYKLLENAGYEVTSDGRLLERKNVIPFDQIFNTGEFQIPLFGTSDLVSGRIDITNPGTRSYVDYIDIIRSMSNNKIKPREKVIGSDRYDAAIPEEYKEALKHNIQWLKENFPGSKEFGSSSTSAYANTPHSTHDIDLLISDQDFANSAEKMFGNHTENGWRVSSKPNSTGFEDTYTHSLGEKYGDAGNIDFNIIYTDPDTGMASSTKGTRAVELFKQFFPSDYRAAVIESMRTGQPLKINKTPKQLIDAYDPTLKTIVDALSSSKAKHIPRAEAHLTTTDPEYVEKALNLYAQEKLGGQAQFMPTTKDMFTDVEQNRRIFDELGYKGVDKETVVNNPSKMKNLVDYWYIHNSIFGRGVQSGSLDAAQLDAAYRVWTGRGGNARGAGLNTVTLGDSGHGDVYGYIQPKLKFEDGQTAEQMIQSAKRQLGHYSYQFTDGEKQVIEDILQKYNLNTDIQGINTPEDILDKLSPSVSLSKDVLQEINDRLGIRALSSKRMYDGGRYNSMTGDVTPDDAVMYQYRAQQEMPVSDVVRDSKTYEENSADREYLKGEIDNLSKKRWQELRSKRFFDNPLSRDKKIEPLRVAKKYDDMTNAEVDVFAKRKVRKVNRQLSERKEQIEKELKNLDEARQESADRVINASSRNSKAERIDNDARWIRNQRKAGLRQLSGFAAALGIPAGIVAATYAYSHKNSAFYKSKEFQQMTKDPRYDKYLDLDDGGFFKKSSFDKLYDEYFRMWRKRVKPRRNK